MIDVWIDKKVMVFDDKLWRAHGGDSATDSFYREATILKVYEESRRDDDFDLLSSKPQIYARRLLADVRFHHSNRVSKGHFVSGMEECPYLTGQGKQDEK